MAPTAIALPADHVKALDALRSRLAQLSTSITLLKQQLEFHETLPAWPALQQNAASVEYNLRKVGETMTAYQQILISAHAYPLPIFPGNSQEHVLQMLLRKKLEPRGEDWIDEAVREDETRAANAETALLDRDALQGLWDWSGPFASVISKELEDADVFKDNYTIAERADGIENVITGIRRNLDSDENDDDDDDEDEEMEIDKPAASKPTPSSNPVQPQTQAVPMSLVNLLSFSSSGDFMRLGR